MPMKPDITFCNATSSHPMIFPDLSAIQILPAGSRRVDDIRRFLIDRFGANGHRRFRALHRKIIAAHPAMRNDPAFRGRPEKPVGGGYSC